MKELYVIRHALAGSRLENEVDDEVRPLKKKGKDRMKAIAKSLKEQKISFDVVLTSPFLRAQESARILNEYCGSDKEAKVTNLLKPDSSYDDLIKFLNKFKSAEKIAIVGHEPFLSGFASYCLSKSQTSFINLHKSGLLRLEIGKIIKPGQCLLTWLIDPKFLI